MGTLQRIKCRHSIDTMKGCPSAKGDGRLSPLAIAFASSNLAPFTNFPVLPARPQRMKP